MHPRQSAAAAGTAAAGAADAADYSRCGCGRCKPGSSRCNKFVRTGVNCRNKGAGLAARTDLSENSCVGRTIGLPRSNRLWAFRYAHPYPNDLVRKQSDQSERLSPAILPSGEPIRRTSAIRVRSELGRPSRTSSSSRSRSSDQRAPHREQAR